MQQIQQTVRTGSSPSLEQSMRRLFGRCDPPKHKGAQAPSISFVLAWGIRHEWSSQVLNAHEMFSSAN